MYYRYTVKQKCGFILKLFSCSVELVVVQKGMADVNEGYEHLGKLLKDKMGELEARLSQLQQIQDETNSLVQWLEKMHTTATSWEAPTDSESVRVHVEQHKVLCSLTVMILNCCTANGLYRYPCLIVWAVSMEQKKTCSYTLSIKCQITTCGHFTKKKNNNN